MTGLDEHSSNSSATKTRYSKSGASKFGIVVSIIGIAFGIFLIIMAFFCGRYWSRFRKLYIFWCRFLHIYLKSSKKNTLSSECNYRKYTMDHHRNRWWHQFFSAMNLSRILIVEKNRQQQQNQIEELCALLRNSQNK